MQKQMIIAAVIVAVGLVLAGLAIGGRYDMTRANEYGAYRLDRWTGKFAVCTRWQGGAFACANAPELYHDGVIPLNASADPI